MQDGSEKARHNSIEYPYQVSGHNKIITLSSGKVRLNPVYDG